MNKVALLAALALLASLAGCYTPRYPGDAPGTQRPPEGQQPDSNVRSRRDSGAGAGSTR